MRAIVCVCVCCVCLIWLCALLVNVWSGDVWSACLYSCLCVCDGCLMNVCVVCGGLCGVVIVNCCDFGVCRSFLCACMLVWLSVCANLVCELSCEIV